MGHLFDVLIVGFWVALAIHSYRRGKALTALVELVLAVLIGLSVADIVPGAVMLLALVAYGIGIFTKKL